MKSKRKHGVNDCFACCIGYKLNIHPLHIPYFVDSKNWFRNFKTYLRRRGYVPHPLIFNKKYLTKNRIHIVQGISPRGNEHCVVYKGTKPIYDPNIKGGFLKGTPHTYWHFQKI